ncbi:hypothetical protein BH11ARM1_BH11ARM1_14260 [soil metagenome]
MLSPDRAGKEAAGAGKWIRRLKGLMKMAKKPKQITDGYGPEERKRIHSAIRQVWQRCTARRIAARRCALPGDFSRCEVCTAMVPKIHIDHIVPAGTIADAGFVERLFCPSSGLQGMCPTCHKAKTAVERAMMKKLKVA